MAFDIPTVPVHALALPELTKIKVNNSNVSDKLIKDKTLNANMDNNTDISRNALCPCGSGKKYKRCCGKL